MLLIELTSISKIKNRTNNNNNLSNRLTNLLELWCLVISPQLRYSLSNNTNIIQKITLRVTAIKIFNTTTKIYII